MTKILNLDKIVTKNDKVIELNGKEHVMKTFTVKEYIYHMREAQALIKTGENDMVDTIENGFEATIKILCNAFPTIKKEEFEALTVGQLDAIMAFIEDKNNEDLEESNNKGETPATGEVA